MRMLSSFKHCSNTEKLKTSKSKIDMYFQLFMYSGCQKYESSPIFVKKLGIRQYPEFLSTQTCTFGAQICTCTCVSTRTRTLCPTIASNIFALTFLPHLLTTL